MADKMLYLNVSKRVLGIGYFVCCLLMFVSEAEAQRLMVFMPGADGVVMPHPLFGEHPGAAKEARFARQESGQYVVEQRITGVVSKERESASVTTITFTIRNQSTTETVSVRPMLDLIDSDGKVLRVMDYKALHAALTASSGRGANSGSSFFAYGSSQFVTGAVGGYLLGSVINEIIESEKRDKLSVLARLMEKHWLRDEYRIPPSSFVVAMVWLRGVPKLPLSSRITIGENIFKFDSVSTEAEAEKNTMLELR